MTGDGSFFPDPPDSRYYHSSKSVLSYHPVLEFNGNKNDFWLLFDDSDVLEKHQSRPLKKPQKPPTESIGAVSKPGFSNTFTEATPVSGFLQPKDEPEEDLSMADGRNTSKDRFSDGPDGKQARLDRLTRSAYDPGARKKEVARERKRSRSSERRLSPSRKRRRSRSFERRRSRSPGRRRSPNRGRRDGDRRGLYGDRRRSRSREGRGRDRSRSRNRFQRSKDQEQRRKSPSSGRKDSRSKRSSSSSSKSSDGGSKVKADNAELLKKFAEKLQEKANKPSTTQKSLSSVRLNSRLEDTKHRRAEHVTPIVFSLKKAPVRAIPTGANPANTNPPTTNPPTTPDPINPPKTEQDAKPMELSEPSEQVSSTIHISLPTTQNIQYTVCPPSMPVQPLVSQVPPPLIPGNLPVPEQPLRVTDGVTVACAPTRYKDGKKEPVSSAVIALPHSTQPPTPIVSVPPPAVSQPLVIPQPPATTTSQPSQLMSSHVPQISQPMQAPASSELHQNLAAQAFEYAAMTQVHESMFQMGPQNMGMPPPGFGPMMRVPPGPPPGLPRPGHGIRPGMMGPGHGSMMMGPGQFGGPGQYMGEGQFMGPPPHGLDGQFMGPPPLGPDGPFMGPPPLGPDGQFMGHPPVGPDGQFMGHPPVGPDGQFMGHPPVGPDGQFMGQPPVGPDGQFMGHPPVGPDGQFMGQPPVGPDRQFMGQPPVGPDGQFMGQPAFGPDGQFMGQPPVGPDGQFMGQPTVSPDGQFMGQPPFSPDGQFMGSFSHGPEEKFMGPPPLSPEGKLTGGHRRRGNGPPLFKPQVGPVSNNIAVPISTSSLAQQPSKNITTVTKVEVKTSSSLKPAPSNVESGKRVIARKNEPRSSTSPLKLSTSTVEKGRTPSSIPDSKESPPKLTHLSIPNFEKVKFMVGLIKFLQVKSNLNVKITSLKTTPSEEYFIKNDLLCKLKKGPDGDGLIIVVPENSNARKTIVTALVLKYPDMDVDALIELFEQTFHDMPMEDIEDVFEDESTRKSTLLKSTNADFSKINSVSPCGTVVLRVESSKNTKLENETTTQKIVEVKKAKPAESTKGNAEKVTPSQKIAQLVKAKSGESSSKNLEKRTPAQKIVQVEKVKPAESSNKRVEKVTPIQKIVEVQKANPAEISKKNEEEVARNQKILEVEKAKVSESSNKDEGKVTLAQKVVESEKAKSSESYSKDVNVEKSKVSGSSDIKMINEDEHSHEKSENITVDSSKDTCESSATTQEIMETSKLQCNESPVSVAAQNIEPAENKKVSINVLDEDPYSEKSQIQHEFSKTEDGPEESAHENKSKLEAVLPQKTETIAPFLGNKPVLTTKENPPVHETTEAVLPTTKVEESASVLESLLKASDTVHSESQKKSLDALEELSVDSETSSNQALPTEPPETPKDVIGEEAKIQTQSEPILTTDTVVVSSDETSKSDNGELTTQKTVTSTISDEVAPNKASSILIVKKPETTPESGSVDNIEHLEEGNHIDLSEEVDEAPTTPTVIGAEQTELSTQYESPKEFDVPADSSSDGKLEVRAETISDSSIIKPIFAEENPPKDERFEDSGLRSEIPIVIEKSTSEVDAASKESGSIDSDIENKSSELVKETTEYISKEPDSSGKTEIHTELAPEVMQTQSEPMETAEILIAKSSENEETPCDEASKPNCVGATTQKTYAIVGSNEETSSGVPSASLAHEPTTVESALEFTEQMKVTSEEKSVFEAIASEEAGASMPYSAKEPKLTEQILPDCKPSVPSLRETPEVIIEKLTPEEHAVSEGPDCIDSNADSMSTEVVKEPTVNISNEPGASEATQMSVTDDEVEIQTESIPKDDSEILFDEKTPPVSSGEVQKSDHVGLPTEPDEVTESGTSNLIVNKPNTAKLVDVKDIEPMKEKKNLILDDEGPSIAISPEPEKILTQHQSSKAKDEAEDSTSERILELHSIESEKAEVFTPSVVETPIIAEGNLPNSQPTVPNSIEAPKLNDQSSSEVDAVSHSEKTKSVDTHSKIEAVKELPVTDETFSSQVLSTDASEPPKVIDTDTAETIKDVASITSNITDTSCVSVYKMPLQSDKLEIHSKLEPLEELPVEELQVVGTLTSEDLTGKVADTDIQPEPMETSNVSIVKEESKTKEDILPETEVAVSVTEEDSAQPIIHAEAMDVVDATDQSELIPEPEIQPSPTSPTNDTTPGKPANLLPATDSTDENYVAVIKPEEVSLQIKEESVSQPGSISVEGETATMELDKKEIIPKKHTPPEKQRFSKFKSTYELMKSMDFGEPKGLYKEPDVLTIVNFDKLSFFTSRLKEIQGCSEIASITTKMLLVPYNPSDEFVMKSGLLCKRKDLSKNDVFIVLLKSTAVYREIVSALTEQFPDLEFNEFMSLIDSSFTYITLDVIKSLTETIDQQIVNINYQNFIDRCNIVNYDIIQTMLEQLRNYQKADSAILHRYTRLKANGGLDDSYILKYDIVCQFVGSIDFKVWLPKSQPDQIAIMYIVHETNHNQDLVKFLELLRSTFEGVNASLIEKPIALCSICHPPATATATSMEKVCEQKCAALKSLPPEVIFKIRQIQMASSVFKAQIDLLTKGQSRQGSRYILDTSLLCKAMSQGDQLVYRVVVSPSGLKEVISLLHMTYHRKPLDEFFSFVNEFLAVSEEVCKTAFKECYMCAKSKKPKSLVDPPKAATNPSESENAEPPRADSSKMHTEKEDAKPKEKHDTVKEPSKLTDVPPEPSSKPQPVGKSSTVIEPEPSKSTWEVKEKATPPPRTHLGGKIRTGIFRDLRRYNSIWGSELAERIKSIVRIVPDRILSDTITIQKSCPELSKSINDLAKTKPIKEAKEMLCGGILFVLKSRTKPKIAVKTIKNINYLLITKLHSEVHDWTINKVHSIIVTAFDISLCKNEVEATIDWFCNRCMKPETRKKKKKFYSSLDEQLEDFYSENETIWNKAKAPKEYPPIETTKETEKNEPETGSDTIYQDIIKDLQKLEEPWWKALGEKIKAVSQFIPAKLLEAVVAAQRECAELMAIIEPLQTKPPVMDARYVLCGRVLYVVKAKKKQMIVKIHVKPIKNINYILITNFHAKFHDWTVNKLQTMIGNSFNVSPTREEVAVTIDWFCLECQKPDTKAKNKKASATLEDQLKDLYNTIHPSLLISKDDDDEEGTIDLTQEVPVTDIRVALAKLPNPVVSKIQQAQVQSNVLNTQIKLLEFTEGPPKDKGYCLVMSLLCKLVEVNGKPAWRVMIPSNLLEELVIELHTVHYHDMIQEDFLEYLNEFMIVSEDMINKLFANCSVCLTTVRRVPTLCERGINEDHLRRTLANIAEMIEYIIKWQTECPEIAKIREGVKRCRQGIIDQYILYKDILFKLSGKGKGGKGPKGKIAVSLLPNALNEVIKGTHAFYHSSNPNQLMNLINTSFDITARKELMLKTIPEVCKICKKKSEAAQQGNASIDSDVIASSTNESNVVDIAVEKEPKDDGASSSRESGGDTIIKEEVDLPIDIKPEVDEDVDLPAEAEEAEPTPLGVLLLGRLCDQVIEESSNSSRALDSPVPDLNEQHPNPVVRRCCKILLKRCKYDPKIVQDSEEATKKKKVDPKKSAKRRKPPNSAKVVKESESSEGESGSGSSLPKRKFVVYSSESETDDSPSKKRKATASSSQKAKKPKK